MDTRQTCLFADAFQLYIQVCANQIIARAVGEHSVRDFPCATCLEPFHCLLFFVLTEQVQNVSRQHNTAFAPGCFGGISAKLPIHPHQRMPDIQHPGIKFYIIPMQGAQLAGADARCKKQIADNFKFGKVTSRPLTALQFRGVLLLKGVALCDVQ